MLINSKRITIMALTKLSLTLREKCAHKNRLITVPAVKSNRDLNNLHFTEAGERYLQLQKHLNAKQLSKPLALVEKLMVSTRVLFKA
jgi:hypothetical protein